MKKKYYILVLTFLCMLCGQASYGFGTDENNGGGLDQWGTPIVDDIGVTIIVNRDPDPIPPTIWETVCFTCECDNSCTPPSGEDLFCLYNPDICYPPIVNPQPVDPNPDDDEPEPEPDCTEADKETGNEISNITNDSDVQSAMGNLPLIGGESGFTIGRYNGDIQTGPISFSSSSSNVTIRGYDANHTIADMHGHDSPSNAGAPSAQDLFALDDKRDKMTGFETSYIRASNEGVLYAMYINDPVKLNNFINENPGFVGSDNNFNNSTGIGKVFWTTVNSLRNQGYSDNESYARATAFILKQAGVSLFRSDSNNIHFKKIDLKLEDIDSDGNLILKIVNCN